MAYTGSALTDLVKTEPDGGSESVSVLDDAVRQVKRFLVDTLLQTHVYPVGSLYFNAAVATNPSTLLGFGTWVAYAEGRVLAGLDVSQTEFDTLEETGGAKEVTLTADQIPEHTHPIEIDGSSTGRVQAGAVDSASGGLIGIIGTTGTIEGAENTTAGDAVSTLQPYITVYIWKRTA